jgi:hypothetical protein
MTKYSIKYISTIYIDVEGTSEDDALMTADRLLLDMTGADFRECCEFESIELQCAPKFSSEDV